MAKSKFFRVAVEGKTFSDGRTIEKKWLTDIAETYNPDTYMARINCEHLRGFSPEKPFFSYGNVKAVKAEEITLDIAGKQEKRLALFAQIEPNAELQRITGAGQKIFTSIEVNPNFAGTGKAYLAGIAATDSPASLGTEVLSFAAKANNNLYTAADEAGAIELEADPAPSAPTGNLLDAFRSLVKAAIGGDPAPAPAPSAPPAPAPAPAAAPANDNAALTAISTALAALPDTLAKLSADQAAATQKVAADLAALTARLEATQANPARPPVTGSGDYQPTDC
ncbi:MAG: GPO family capsid scaffolding protein [Sphingomonadales bacterium]|jgi:hypothetical protein